MENGNEKWAFIVNPVAGNGAGLETVPLLREMISRHAIAAEIAMTENYGHATKLAAAFAERGFTNIIAVGGDGTFNETARALAGKQGITTGIIPAGTGNDFIQVLGFPDRFGDSDWEAFFRKATARIDAGYCNGRIFMNGMGLGFDAQVAAENYTRPGEVKKGGKHKYIWHILKTLLFFREKKMIVLTPDGKLETDCFINTVAIGRRFAGGFFLTPKALADDGLLDVCMIKKLTLPERLRILLMVPKGTHINDRRINYKQTPSLSLEFEGDVPFHLDGELFFGRHFDISIRPGAMNIIYNPDGKHFFGK